MEHAQDRGGLSITVACFRDTDGLRQWQAHPEHHAAQKRGRAQWYERYALHVAKVERSHGFVREG